MELLKKRLANLLLVKSIVTICLTVTFCVLTVTDTLSTDFMTIYSMVIAFYFCTQTARQEGGAE